LGPTWTRQRRSSAAALGERILRGAQQREQFVQTETETARRDLELGIQRRLIYVGQR
jgi:hypothetical protein